MALTPGTRQLLREIASWAVVVVIGAAAFTHFDELKTGTEQLLGPSDARRRSPRAADAAARCRCRDRQVRHPGRDQGRAQRSLQHRRRDQRAQRRRHGRYRRDHGRRSATRTPNAPASILNQSDFSRAVTTANGVARIRPRHARPRLDRRHHRARCSRRRGRAGAPQDLAARHELPEPAVPVRHALERARAAGIGGPPPDAGRPDLAPCEQAAGSTLAPGRV